jgi:hypothetical protein
MNIFYAEPHRAEQDLYKLKYAEYFLADKGSPS